MHEVITSIDEKLEWLHRMVQFKEASPLYVHQWREVIESVFVYGGNWTLVELEQPIPSEYTELYIEKCGEWLHGNEYQQKHNALGMAYVAWIRKRTPDIQIILSDSPDIIGKIGKQRICGDIGRCSQRAMFWSIQSLSFHDLWISVLDYNTQIIIEIIFNPNALKSAATMHRKSKKEQEKMLQEAFFCPTCREWTLDKNERQALLESYNSFTPSMVKSPSGEGLDTDYFDIEWL